MNQTQTVSRYDVDTAHTVTFLPKEGTISVGAGKLRFDMTPDNVHQILGQPEHVKDGMDSHQYSCERYFDSGVMLRYCDKPSAYPCRGGMFLNEVMIAERFGWQVKVNDIPLFADEQLARMKREYPFIESRRRMVVAFPSMGIFTVGCGERESRAPDGRSKTVMLCGGELMEYYISIIGSWGCWS